MRPWTHYFSTQAKPAAHAPTPLAPGRFPPAIRRLPAYTTRGIGVKGLDMVRWPAPPPGEPPPSSFLLPRLRVGGGLGPDLFVNSGNSVASAMLTLYFYNY